MSLFKLLVAAGSFVSTISASSLLAPRSLLDTYTLYQGPADPNVWPAVSSWVSSFDTMFTNNLPNINVGCAQFGVAVNSATEIAGLKSAIQQVSASSGVDPRFILAIVIQESVGCVRAPTTVYSIANPGLMQSHEGTGSCNRGGSVQNPCPQSEIVQMIQDGAVGTASGDGLARILPQAPLQNDMKYYQAARMYNSGSIDSTGYLERGVATHCYASDVANRLTGWVSAPSKCFFDSQGLPPFTPYTPTPRASQAAATTGFQTSVVTPAPAPSAQRAFGAVLAAPSSSKSVFLRRGPKSSSVPSPVEASTSTANKVVAGNPAPGVTTDCSKYYRIQSGDYCGLVTSKNNISTDQFKSLNPGINSDCSNLWLGYDYCVAPAS